MKDINLYKGSNGVLYSLKLNGILLKNDNETNLGEF